MSDEREPSVDDPQLQAKAIPGGIRFRISDPVKGWASIDFELEAAQNFANKLLGLIERIRQLDAGQRQ